MKLLICILFFFVFVQTHAVKPEYRLKTNAAVIDFIVDNQKIYVATFGGTIEIFDFKTKKRLHEIQFPLIKDFTNEQITSRIYSIDKLPSSENLLAVVQRSDGFRDLYQIIDNKPVKLLDGAENHLMIKEARYISKEAVLIGLLGNEIINYNFFTKKIEYRIQVSSYTFSDFVLHESLKMFVTADESGEINMYNTQLGKKAYTFKGLNKDNVFQLDYKNNTIITAGQDRIVGLYNMLKIENYTMHSSFIVYSVALSPKALYAAYYANEKNEIFVFETKTKIQKAVLTGHNSVVTKILFIDEQTILSSAEDKEILFWKL